MSWPFLLGNKEHLKRTNYLSSIYYVLDEEKKQTGKVYIRGSFFGPNKIYIKKSEKFRAGTTEFESAQKFGKS